MYDISVLVVPAEADCKHSARIQISKDRAMHLSMMASSTIT